MRLRVLRDRNLRLLFAGQATNMFGNTAMVIVLAIWVKDLTGSNSAAGVVFLLLAMATLFAPVGGLIADRFPRRQVLIVNDVAAGILVASLLFVHDRSALWLIYVVTFGYGMSGQVYRAARGGLLHSMVPAELLGDANGLFSSLAQGLRVIGPVAGAAIYTVAGGGVVALINTATFAVSVWSFVLLRDIPDLRTPADQRPHLLAEVAAGVRHVMGNAVIRRIILASAAGFCGAGMANVAMLAMIEDGLHRPPAMLGVLGGVQGAGSVIAGLLVGRAMRRFGEYAVASVGFLLNGAGLFLITTATLPGAFSGAVLVGLGLPIVLVAEITLLQKRTPGELQGRAIAASDAIIDIPFATAIGVGTLIIGSVGFRPIFITVATAFAVVGLVLLRYQSVTRPQPEPATTADDLTPQAQGGGATARAAAESTS